MEDRGATCEKHVYASYFCLTPRGKKKSKKKDGYTCIDTNKSSPNGNISTYRLKHGATQKQHAHKAHSRLCKTLVLLATTTRLRFLLSIGASGKKKRKEKNGIPV
jgi:hypothetical protein